MVRLDDQLLGLAPDLARAAGLTEDRELAGLVRLHRRCSSAGTATVSALDIASAWALGPTEAARFMEVHLSAGVLAPDPVGFRVPSCAFYAKERAARSAGGKKARGNLKQYSTPKSVAPVVGLVGEPLTKKPRALSAQEECWDWMEHLRVEHSVRLGLEPGASPRPKFCNKRLNDAIEAVGIVDFIIGQTAVTRWEHLAVLFELYLLDELGRVDGRDGRLRSPPWPIEFFLSPTVLRRFKELEEKAA